MASSEFFLQAQQTDRQTNSSFSKNGLESTSGYKRILGGSALRARVAWPPPYVKSALP